METLIIPETGKLNSENQADSSMQWKQLWSLAALYGSIIIGWIAYQNYQPKLLLQFQFTDFTFLLILCQGIILVITPLVAGKLGDRFRFEKGHRLPIISSGISFAAMIFMAVAFTLIGNPGEIFKWILPFLIILWLIAMSIFTSPALSTMELFTPVDKLPHAMALLTIVANLIYALEPIIVDIIDYLGAPVTFICGGIIVFLSGYALKKNSLDLFKHSGNKEATPVETIARPSRYGFIFFLGLSLGIATTLMFNLFPEILETKLQAIIHADGKIMVVGILLLSALLSWPMSYAVNKYGMLRVFWLSLMVILLSTIGIIMSTLTVVLIFMVILFAITFASLSVSALPLAIHRANHYEKVFCVGLFFSGVALPDGFFKTFEAGGMGIGF